MKKIYDQTYHQQVENSKIKFSKKLGVFHFSVVLGLAWRLRDDCIIWQQRQKLQGYEAAGATKPKNKWLFS